MDNKKDTAAISQKDEKSLQNKDIFFGSKRTIAFAYKKTEKLASAVYLVTDLLRDEEALKWELRQKSLALVSDTGALVLKQDEISVHTIKRIARTLYEMLSLFDIAGSAKVISDMNLTLLKKEFRDLIDFLTKEIYTIEAGSSVMIASQFFDIEENELSKTILQSGSVYSSKGQIKDSYRSNDLYSPIETYSTKDTKDKTISSIKASVAVKDIDRKNKIIGLVSKSPTPVSIKDISVSLTNVSEKTVQRDLLALVSEGVLKKEGERRWSRYSLI